MTLKRFWVRIQRLVMREILSVYAGDIRPIGLVGQCFQIHRAAMLCGVLPLLEDKNAVGFVKVHNRLTKAVTTFVQRVKSCGRVVVGCQVVLVYTPENIIKCVACVTLGKDGERLNEEFLCLENTCLLSHGNIPCTSSRNCFPLPLVFTASQALPAPPHTPDYSTHSSHPPPSPLSTM